jgi:hypothetical protein
MFQHARPHGTGVTVFQPDRVPALFQPDAPTERSGAGDGLRRIVKEAPSAR